MHYKFLAHTAVSRIRNRSFVFSLLFYPLFSQKLSVSVSYKVVFYARLYCILRFVIYIFDLFLRYYGKPPHEVASHRRIQNMYFSCNRVNEQKFGNIQVQPMFL